MTKATRKIKSANNTRIYFHSQFIRLIVHKNIVFTLRELKVFQTLPSIVLLKFIAFDDRSEMRSKDARHIANIIIHYFDLQADFIYKEHSDLFIEDNEQTLEEISAIVLEREVRKIASANPTLLSRIQNFLKNSIEQGDESAFVTNMVAETGMSVEKNVKLLQNILTSL